MRRWSALAFCFSLWLPGTWSDKTAMAAETSTVRYCNCAFDCIFPSGIKHHGVSLTEVDLSMLPDLEPWRLDMALQRKCMERFDNFRFPTPPSKSTAKTGSTDGAGSSALPDHAEPLPEPQRPEAGETEAEADSRSEGTVLEDDIFESLVFFTLFIVCSACVAAILMLNRGVGARRVSLHEDTAAAEMNGQAAAAVSYAASKSRRSPDSEVSWSPLPLPQRCSNDADCSHECKVAVLASASASSSSSDQCSACLLHYEDEPRSHQHQHHRQQQQQQALYF